MATSVHPDLAEVPLTSVLAALADPLRLGIVRLLADGAERQCGELDTPVSKSTLSHHMKVLRMAGVIRARSEGTRCYAHLRREELDERFPGLLNAGPRAPRGGLTKGGGPQPLHARRPLPSGVDAHVLAPHRSACVPEDAHVRSAGNR